MRGAIIAAGEGSRLRRGGWTGSKAMARVGGRPLIGHALDRFRASGFARVSVIINEASEDCRGWLADADLGLEIDLVVKTTPSSFASFDLLAQRLAGAPTVLTTVDGVMPEADFAGFVAAVARLPDDAIALGVTPHVDDEAPLWADLDPESGRIRRLGGGPAGFVTAGVYALPAERPALDGRRFERLREYLAWLVAEKYPVYGLVLPRVFDVDRPEDIVQAERSLVEQVCPGGVG